MYVEVDGEMNSLLPFHKSVHFRSIRGAHNMGQQQARTKGEDVVVKVPPGTMVRSSDGGVELFQLTRFGQRALIGISLCTWSLWGWFFSASWTAFRVVRAAS